MWRWINCSKLLSKPEPLQLLPKLYAATPAISSVVWTLRKCSYGILILSSAKFLSGIQCRNTSILPGFDNYKITTRRKRKNQHIKKATFPFFLFLSNWRYNPITTERVRSCFSTKQNTASSFWWPLGSLLLVSKRNSTIAILHYK